MTRQTSVEAYEQIRASGVLGERTWQTYSELFKNGPMTQAECWSSLAAAGQMDGVPQRSITPRFAQLLRRGLVRYLLNDDGTPLKRKCSVSGIRCMVWDVTSGFAAQEEPVQKGQLARANERIRQLEELVAKLIVERDAALRSLGHQLRLL